MIITRKYARTLIRAGRATINGAVCEPDSRAGVRSHVIVTRQGLQRADHYEYTAADKPAVDAAESRYV